MRVKRILAMMVALLALVNVPPVGAEHGADAPTWIVQAGNGAGERSPLLENFSLRTALFDALRFRSFDCAARAGFTKYTSWGVATAPAADVVLDQLVMTRSENGTDWSTPVPNMLRNPDGGLVPFLLGEGFADIAFQNNTIRPPGAQQTCTAPYDPARRPFVLYWMAGSDSSSVLSIHRAFSDDGVVWEQETPIIQGSDLPQGVFSRGGHPVVGGAAWKMATAGPSDVIYQPTGSTATWCGAADPLAINPWACPWVLVYDAAGDERNVGLAGSPDGTTFYGLAQPIVSAGAAGQWDDTAATFAHVRRAGENGFTLYYSGGDGPPTECSGGGSACWSIGIATSTDGLVWQKASNNPVTPRALLDAVGQKGPGTLLAAQVVDDAADNGGGHARIFFSRITNGALPDDLPRADTYLAYTSPAPAQTPTIMISQPVGPFRHGADTPIEFYLTDTFGSAIGVDLRTLVVTIDGTAIPWDRVEEPHLVGALKFPSLKVTRESGTVVLDDGLHVFTVEVADHDGNVAVASSDFVIDTTAPATVITSTPSSNLPRTGFPVGSIGMFRGETAEDEAGVGISKIEVVVTDPLGRQKAYLVSERPELTQKPSDKLWRWTWVGPVADPHFLLPGPYTVTFLGVDIAQNREIPNTENTTTVLLI